MNSFSILAPRSTGFLAAVCCACLLIGCAGDQANRQGSTFRDLRVDAAGNERQPDGPKRQGAGADDGVRSSLATIEARQDSTQQSMSGLGAQVREIRADVESLAKISLALHSDIKTELQNELRINAAMNAVACAEVETRLDAKLDVDTKVETLATAVAELTAHVDALAQVQASAQVGIGNEMRSTISELRANAGRDVNSTQFTQEMAGVYERFIGSFVWGLVIAAVVGIAAIAAASFILVRSKEDSRRRAEERERELRSAVMDRGRPAHSLPGRLDDETYEPKEDEPW